MNGAYAIKQSFSLEVKSDNKYTCNAVFPLVITNFALLPGEGEGVVVNAEVTLEGDSQNKHKTVCCTLNPKFCPQYSTNLVYSAGESVEFTLSSGDGMHSNCIVLLCVLYGVVLVMFIG